MTQPMDLTSAPYAFREVTSWRDRLLQRLERLYASPALYQWSLKSPLTRWIVRRRTQKLFDLMSGFVYTQVMLGCLRLDLFKQLHQAPADRLLGHAQTVGGSGETTGLHHLGKDPHVFVRVHCLALADSQTLYSGFFPRVHLPNLRTSRSDGPLGQARRPLPTLAQKRIRS